MKIAIIGTGIAGNVVAYHLHKQHDISVFESNNYIGGHTHTHDINVSDQRFAIDTGFIVFNYKTYPHFTQLLKTLNVDVQESSMSFSVKSDQTGLEYNGSTLNSLFAQRSNLLRPSFYRMIRDILRFNQEALALLNTEQANVPLGIYLQQNGYSDEFIKHYLIPMGAAIWSTSPKLMMDFPSGFFVRFFHNHGMLSVDDRPTWYVIKGGSKEYVKKLTAPFRDRIFTDYAVKSVSRSAEGVDLIFNNGDKQRFDQVFIATHSNQALEILSDASEAEKQILESIPYQKNQAVLHTDETLLPKRRLAWAAWNYHILPTSQEQVALTYNMNILQGLRSKSTFCVTLNNRQDIAEEKIIKTIDYEHPIFTPDGILAQQRQAEINGVNRTYYCGAYWRYGFHEDGVWSALNALEHFEENSNEQLLLHRAS